MAELRNPFAVKDGAIVMIEDLSEEERGLKCNCLCPACNDAFIARMGNLKIHHFAHSTEGCDEIQAYMAGLYRLLKEMVNMAVPLYLPPTIIEYRLDPYYPITRDTIESRTKLVPKYDNSSSQIQVTQGKKYIFENAEYALNSKGQIQALLLILQSKKLAIRITPPNTVCKIAHVSQYKNFATLEMDFRNDEEKIRNSNRIVLEQYISNDQFLSRWVYNPIVSSVYPEILKRSEEFSTRAKELRKMKIEEAKKQAEDQRKEQTKIQRCEQLTPQNSSTSIPKNSLDNKEEIHLRKEKVHKLGYEEIKELFTQQTDIIIDRFQTRWVQCEICGEIKQENEFVSYGGINHVNLGICSLCSKKV